jgi:Domain of unknown function (DUF4157)
MRMRERTSRVTEAPHSTGVGHASGPDAARKPSGPAQADALRHDERSACPLAAPSDGVFAFAKIPILPAEAASAELPATTRAPALQGGRPLARAAPDYFAPRFGFDFSKVRIHDDAAAHRLAAQLEAEAFTRADHIAFARDRYAPHTHPGRRLLAHELTHVVQQARGAATGLQPRPRVAAPSDAAEREADVIALDPVRPGLWSVTQRSSSAVHLQPAPKAKPKAKDKEEEKPAPTPPKVTLATVEETVGLLTSELAAKAFTAYSSPLAGHEDELIAAFDGQKLSAWIGLAIIAQESSFANQANNPSLDERNEANPFSVHFTSPTKWPKGCGKNALLIADAGKSYAPSEKVNKQCAAKGHRLPTFAESAKAAAKVVATKGLAAYREAGGYEQDLNARLNNILQRIHLAPKK